MATTQNLTFALGEDWIIQLFCCDSEGNALVGVADVQLAIGDRQGHELMTQTTTSGAEIIDAATGEAAFRIAPSAQTIFVSGLYAYQARAVLQDETVSLQAAGSLYLTPSLF